MNRLMLVPIKYINLILLFVFKNLKLNQENSLLVSDLQQERKKYGSAHQKTLKQRLTRIKENIIRALNKEKWKNNNT